MDKTRKNKKKGVRRLGSDREFLTAFLEEDTRPVSQADKGEKLNRHGLPFVEDYETRFTEENDPGDLREPPPGPTEIDEEEEENFAELLARSFRDSPLRPSLSNPFP